MLVCFREQLGLDFNNVISEDDYHAVPEVPIGTDQNHPVMLQNRLLMEYKEPGARTRAKDRQKSSQSDGGTLILTAACALDNACSLQGTSTLDAFEPRWTN
ncbi:MAG: hypothetical protein HDQ87_01700 [Clostridia bacterium]|nr:hypothetical protein [Clostridia bacterium]